LGQGIKLERSELAAAGAGQGGWLAAVT
jgi:hypothetical protein